MRSTVSTIVCRQYQPLLNSLSFIDEHLALSLY